MEALLWVLVIMVTLLLIAVSGFCYMVWKLVAELIEREA
jgi:hypothetical protein